MTTSRYGILLACVVMLGLAIPGSATAGGGQGCSILGSWFGVESFENKVLTGWTVTATGKSENHGTNNLEFPTFDPTLGGIFPTAVRGSTNRGAWQRISGDTFEYWFMSILVDAANQPVWIAKVSGDVSLSHQCNFETITATMHVYSPTASPFDGDPLFSMPLPEHYGYRVQIQ